MLGGNYARFLRIDWSLDETLEQMRSLEPRWSSILGGGKPDGPETPHDHGPAAKTPRHHSC
jgi:hypothetical protein